MDVHECAYTLLFSPVFTASSNDTCQKNPVASDAQASRVGSKQRMPLASHREDDWGQVRVRDDTALCAILRKLGRDAFAD